MQKPRTLEEAFFVVQNKSTKENIALTDPFATFVASLASTIKKEKETFVPKQEEVIVEEIHEPQIIARDKIKVTEALTSLQEALLKAKQEIALQQEERIRQQLIIEKEESEKEEDEQDKTDEPSEDSSEPEEEKQPDNPYVKELAKTTRFDVPKPKADEGQSEIKRMISEQVNAELEAFRRQLFSSNLMMGGGGGGTNAVQYAAGGTMNGDLNVNGHILSGGLDLSEAIRNTVRAAVADIGSVTLPDPLIVKDLNY